ncbi:MAG: hypothetical protein ACMXYL_02050 [Candidatus Woesearchaeota archaeon]
MGRGNMRRLGIAGIIAGVAALGAINVINANPFTSINPKTTISYEDVIAPASPSFDNIGEYQGIKLLSGMISLQSNTTIGLERLESPTPNEESVESALETILGAVDNYPPYMLREQCNLQAIYLTGPVTRTLENEYGTENSMVGGIAFRGGVMAIAIPDSNIRYDRVRSTTHHEIKHICEFANVDNQVAFDNEWINLSKEHGASGEYLGEQWRNYQSHATNIMGFPNSYSMKNPVEHRAVMWQEVMGNYTNAHYRFRDDKAYQQLFYHTIRTMREWSDGMMDHEVYGLIARGEVVDENYYIRVFGDDAYRFRPY